MRVDVIDPNLDTRSSVTGGALRQHPYLNQRLLGLSDSDPDGDYKGVFVATDSYKDAYRDHRNKPMLAVNDTKAPKPADTYHWLIQYNVPGLLKDFYTTDRYDVGEIARGLQGQIAHHRDVLPHPPNDTYTAANKLYAGYRARADKNNGLSSKIVVEDQIYGNHNFFDPKAKVVPGPPLQAALFTRNLRTDALAYVFTHSLAKDGGILNPKIGYLVAGHYSLLPHNHNDTSFFVGDVATNAELVVYGGCDTGSPNISGHGDLLAETRSSGAKMAIGFTTEISGGEVEKVGWEPNPVYYTYYDYPKYWAAAFWSSLTRGERNTPGYYDPLTVKFALPFAVQAVKSLSPSGKAMGYDHSRVLAQGGNGDVYLDLVNQ